MGLDGVSAREPVAEVLGECFHTDADGPMVQIFFYVAVAVLASSGKRDSQAPLAAPGRNRACQWLRSVGRVRLRDGCHHL